MPQRQLGQRYSDPAWSQWSQSVVCRWDTDFSSSTTSLNSPHETRDGTSNCTNSPSAPNHTCKSRMSRKSPHSRQMNPPFAPWRDHSHSPPRKRAPSSCSDWDAPCAPSTQFSYPSQWSLSPTTLRNPFTEGDFAVGVQQVIDLLSQLRCISTEYNWGRMLGSIICCLSSSTFILSRWVRRPTW